MIKEIQVKAVVAVNNLGFIGKNRKLLWKCSEDIEHFKKLISGKTIIVGYNTLTTLPRSIRNLVKDIVADQRDRSAEEVLDSLEGEIWCIGGKKTYEKYAPLITEFHISKINDNGVGDCVFPDLSNLNPDCKVFNYCFEIDDSVEKT